jgi:WD40 repeat protein
MRSPNPDSPNPVNPSTLQIGQGARGIIGQTVIGATIVEQQLLITPDAIALNPFQARSPYKALKRFDVDDSEYFFGRYQLTRELQTALKTNNLILVLGASGSGKSSVVRAKLVPEFLSESSHHHNFVLTPGENPFRSLYDSLIGQGKLGPDKDYYFSPSETQFVLEGKPDKLLQVVRQLKEARSQWLIVIDQFEELFTRCTNLQQRQQFIQSITQLAESGDGSVKMVLVMRADFLGEFAPYPQFGKRVQQQIHLVTEMPEDELELAIKAPAAKHGVRLEPGLAREIIADVQGQPGSLPLMQYTLTRLWDYEIYLDHLADRVLNTCNYQALGKVRGALENHVNQIYADLDAIGQQAAKRIFLSLVKVFTTDGVEKRVSQSVCRSALNGDAVPATLNRFINENLLISSCQDLSQTPSPTQTSHPQAEATIEIAHEILLTSWPPLQNWIQEAQATLLVKSRLVEDMARWKQHQQSHQELLKSSMLAKVLDLQEHHLFELHAVPLNSDEHAYIRASQQFQRRELNRAKRVAMAASMGAGLLTVAMGFSALQMRQAESEQIQTSVALSQAKSALGQDLEAQLEIIRAGKTLKQSVWQAIFPDAGLRRAIAQQAENPGQERNRWPASVVHPGGAGPSPLWLSPDGQRLSTVDYEGKLRQWSPQGQLQAEVETRSGRVTLSPDGQQVLIHDSAGTLQLRQITGQTLLTLPVSVSTQVAFSPNSQWLAIPRSSHNGAIEWWNHPRQQLTRLKLSGYDATIQQIVFSTDSKQFATSGDDGTIRLWDLDGKPLSIIKADCTSTGLVQQVSNRFPAVSPKTLGTKQGCSFNASGVMVFSPDGTRLAASVGDGMAQIWDTRTGQRIASFSGHKGLIQQILFSPNGQHLVTRGADGTVRIWKSEGRFGYADNQLAVLTGHAGTIHAVAFSPDGKQLATGGSDGTVRLWDTDETKLPINGENGSFDLGDRRWNPTGSLLAVFNGHSGRVNVAFHPDGKHLAALGENGILHLWDTTLPPTPPAKNSPDPAPQVEKFDHLLSRNCHWVWNYLKHSPMVADRDRPLCHGITTGD